MALVLPRNAAVSGRTAAWIHGVDARAPDEQADRLELVCCVASPRMPMRRPGVTCVQANIDGRDVVEVDGVPVTSPGRTALDLARTEPPHMALACLDALVRRHRLDPRDLLDQLARFAGGRGVVQARRMLGLCDPGAESFGESWTRLRILDAGFPRPETQVVVDRGPGLAPYRLDMGWRPRRIAVEYDGEEFHSAPEQRRHDAVRRAWIERECGWQVVPVTKGDVLGRQPRLELGLGEVLGIAPLARRRAW